MRVICVDDERLLMQDTVNLCLEIDLVDEAKGFTKPAEALRWLEHEQADIALLDIDMPGMNGMELAARIKQRHPQTAILFLTGYSQYAVDAFSLHVSGYLLKPVDPERLAAELAYVFARKPRQQHAHIEARTFGNFDLLVDGKAISFKQAKCKELLAYLVDRRGSSVTRAEAFAILWGDRLYDRPMQKQFDVIIRSLRETLQEQGIAELLEIRSGNLRIRHELIDCDLYRFLNGDVSALNEYRGEYLNGYAWAELTGGYMSRRLNKP